MRFTEQQVKQFKTDGYLVVPEFFNSREVEALQAEIDRLKRVGKLRNVATDGDGKTHSATKANLQLCPMSPHSQLFKTLPFATKVRDAVSQLIGDPVVLHLDQVFLKPAGNGAGTNWHQDNAYFKVENPLMGTAMWTAVHDSYVENGTLRVIPGSHLDKLEHSRDPDSDHHIRCYPGEDNVVYATMKAGGVIFFAYGVAHATGPNTTASDRAGAAYHFLNGNAIPGDYFTSQGDAMPHPFLTGPGYDGGASAYGEKLDGAWESVVEGACPPKSAALKQPG
ncbi:MAG TPA: phytanoyl-CoA dioxygenase family protein [Capsulimonadaceae bacterium]